jgi:hypothetical protein
VRSLESEEAAMENEQRSWTARLKTLFGRAKSEAGDLAETAMLRVEISQLMRRREAVFRAIGARVYEKNQSGAAVPGFEAEVAEIRDMDERIALKKAAMAGAGGAPADASGAGVR